MVSERKNAVFQCDSSGVTKWFMWDKFTDTLKNLPSNAEVDGSSLIITNVQCSNQGNYECQGELGEYHRYTGLKIKFAARATLVCRMFYNK